MPPAPDPGTTRSSPCPAQGRRQVGRAETAVHPRHGDIGRDDVGPSPPTTSRPPAVGGHHRCSARHRDRRTDHSVAVPNDCAVPPCRVSSSAQRRPRARGRRGRYWDRSRCAAPPIRSGGPRRSTSSCTSPCTVGAPRTTPGRRRCGRTGSWRRRPCTRRRRRPGARSGPPRSVTTTSRGAMAACSWRRPWRRTTRSCASCRPHRTRRPGGRPWRSCAAARSTACATGTGRCSRACCRRSRRAWSSWRSASPPTNCTRGSGRARGRSRPGAGLLASPYDERLYRVLLRAADLEGNPAGVERVMAELLQVVGGASAGRSPRPVGASDLRAVHPETATLYRSLSRWGAAGSEGAVDQALGSSPTMPRNSTGKWVARGRRHGRGPHLPGAAARELVRRAHRHHRPRPRVGRLRPLRVPAPEEGGVRRSRRSASTGSPGSTSTSAAKLSLRWRPAPTPRPSGSRPRGTASSTSRR